VGAAATSLAVVIVLVASNTGASAQVPQPLLPPLLPPPSSPAPAPQPGAPAEPAPTTTTTTPLLLKVLQPPPPTTAPPPPPSAAPAPAASTPVPNNGGGDGVAPADAGPFPADLQRMSNSVRRSAARNTRALMDGVRSMIDLGVPADEAMRAVFGRFPVAGAATYSHDWWLPRFGPGWRLHLGTDIFATRGTPVRSPTDGVVRLSDGGLGGISVYVVQDDGTYFYLAHLNNRVPGLRDGASVRTGDVVGYVGSTGNASGGSPHLHFEVHPAPVKIVTKGKGKNRTTTVIPLRVRPGTVLPAVDPKAYLDRALQDAATNLPAVIAAYQANRPPPPVGPIASFPGALVAGGLPTELASVAAPVEVERSLARLPLFLLAFLLVLLVGALTPVLAPRRAGGSGGAARTASRAAAASGRTGRRPGGRRRGSSGPVEPSAPVRPAAETAGPPPAPAAQPPPARTFRFGAAALRGAEAAGNSTPARRRRRRSKEPSAGP
jgi:murein DD-endopeptidase MepM/ murein hydrolase activator NlpD